MKRERQRLIAVICLLAILPVSGYSFAQSVNITGKTPVPIDVSLLSAGTFKYFDAKYFSKVVKGAPYSATAVTEYIQTLGDGNRIIRKKEAKVYRDGEGRTRLDQKLDTIGKWTAAGDARQMVYINDPVKGFSYNLDPGTRTVRKTSTFKYEELNQKNRDEERRLREQEERLREQAERLREQTERQKEQAREREERARENQVRDQERVKEQELRVRKQETRIRENETRIQERNREHEEQMKMRVKENEWRTKERNREQESRIKENEWRIRERNKEQEMRIKENDSRMKERSRQNELRIKERIKESESRIKERNRENELRTRESESRMKERNKENEKRLKERNKENELRIKERNREDEKRIREQKELLKRIEKENEKRAQWPEKPIFPASPFKPIDSTGKKEILISDNKKKIESLGKQTIEGVEVEGTRSTRAIPVGEIGNTLPIEVIDESWYSRDLQVLVMTKHDDPRSGMTTYRLNNIQRSEPERALFEVPSDYISVPDKKGGKVEPINKPAGPAKPAEPAKKPVSAKKADSTMKFEPMKNIEPIKKAKPMKKMESPVIKNELYQ